MMSRSLIQIFDVKSKQMLQYGKGYVEYSGNPDRLSSRFATKLVRWADHSYDPLNFSLQHGMDPDRHEMPFCNAYVELAFNWVDTIAPDAIRNTVTCAKCYKNDETKKQMVCKDCRLAFYCGRKCQILHWNEAHKAVCQKRDFKTESINNFEQEKTAFSSVIIELSDRMNGKRGIKKLIKMAENDFDGIEGVPEKEVAGKGDQEVNVLREEPVE
ncbi:ubiquitin-specific protease, partial [Bonamia ostreae]